MKKLMLIMLACGIAAATYSQPVVGEKQASVVTQIFDESSAGTTNYDLQCYRSMRKRIYAFSDGTIGATWMIAEETTNWTDRGTGYNYYDGNDWGPEPTARIESVKTGFPCYAPYGPNGEIVVAHYMPAAMEAVLLFQKRDNKGTGSWEEFMLEGPGEDYLIYSPAMITNGQDNMNIHVLASAGPDYQNMPWTVLYYRSTDGGETWDISNYFFDEINNEVFSSISGDVFAWAQPRGDTIAFSVGFQRENGYIMKSYDNGDNWERIDVYENPYSPYAGEVTPWFGAADRSHSLALNTEGNCHIVFGRMKYMYDEEGNYWWSNGTEGIVYWNETMDILDTTIISTYTLEHLIEGGNLIGWTIPYQGDSSIIDIARYYRNSMTSFPQINIDDNDNIYVVWSAVAPGHDNFQYNYRHICGTGSIDGGETWSDIKDYNLGSYYLFKECVFPSMSPTFYGDKVHILFQCDPEPGMYVTPPEPNYQSAPTENEMLLMQIPIGNFFVGIDEPWLAEQPVLDVSPAYPNPCNDKAFININLANKSDVTIRILNTLGQVMCSEQYQSLSARGHKLEINTANLKAGAYCYVIEAGGKSGTGTLLKK